jgi:hypothetical protein
LTLASYADEEKSFGMVEQRLVEVQSDPLIRKDQLQQSEKVNLLELLHTDRTPLFIEVSAVDVLATSDLLLDRLHTFLEETGALLVLRRLLRFAEKLLLPLTLELPIAKHVPEIGSVVGIGTHAKPLLLRFQLSVLLGKPDSLRILSLQMRVDLCRTLYYIFEHAFLQIGQLYLESPRKVYDLLRTYVEQLVGSVVSPYCGGMVQITCRLGKSFRYFGGI